jgi:hypothetical protein
MNKSHLPFLFTYWQPWKKESNLIDNYFNYLKDKNLIDYSSKSIGEYIKTASAEQLSVLNRMDSNMKIGFNQLENVINKKLDSISKIQEDIKNTLSEILIYSKLPDFYKQWLYHIQSGINFYSLFLDGQNYLDDAFDEFTEANKLIKNDYISLYFLGLIKIKNYKYLNIEEALLNFKDAFKYASSETNFDKIKLTVLITGNKPTKATKVIFEDLKILDKGKFLEFKKTESYTSLLKVISNIKECDLNHVPKLIESTPFEIFTYSNMDKNLLTKLRLSQINLINLSFKNIGKVGSGAELVIKSVETEDIDLYNQLFLEFKAQIIENIAICNYLNDEFELAYQNQVEANLMYKNFNIDRFFSTVKFASRSGKTHIAIEIINKHKMEIISEIPYLLLDIDILSNTSLSTHLIDLETKEIKKIQDKNEKQVKLKNDIAIFLTKTNSLIYPVNFKNDFNITKNKIKNLKSDNTNKNYERFQQLKNTILKKSIELGQEQNGGIVSLIDIKFRKGIIINKSIEKISNWGINIDTDTQLSVEKFKAVENNNNIVKNHSFRKIFLFTKKVPSIIDQISNSNGAQDWLLPTKDDLISILESYISNSSPVNLKLEKGIYWTSSVENGKILGVYFNDKCDIINVNPEDNHFALTIKYFDFFSPNNNYI